MSERVLVLQTTELTYQVGDPQPKKEVKAVYQVPKNVDFSAVQRFLREHEFEYPSAKSRHALLPAPEGGTEHPHRGVATGSAAVGGAE